MSGPRSCETEVTPLPDELDDKRDRHLFFLIATGLMQWWENALRAEQWNFPPPPALQRGWNLLVFRCLQREQPPPVSISDLLDWCARRLDQWPINPRPDTPWTPDVLGPFLENGSLTGNCEFWFWQSWDIEADFIQTDTMEKVFDLASESRRYGQEIYVYFRRTLIVNPVVTDYELSALKAEWGRLVSRLVPGGKDSPLGTLLTDCYERVTLDMALNGRLQACPVCRHLLRPTKEGTWRCEDRRCYPEWGWKLPLDRSWETKESLYQLSRPYRRYLSRPGGCEVRLEQEITSLGAKVQMWPRLDACDLDITFPSGRVWCVDVKDWENPRQLGWHIREKRKALLDQPGDRHVFVVPQRRLEQDPDYLAALSTVYSYRTPEVLGEKEFLSLVAARLREEPESRR